MTQERRMALRLAADVILRIVRDAEGNADADLGAEDEAALQGAIVSVLDATVTACAPAVVAPGVMIVPAPGDMCGGTRLVAGAPCLGCRACA